MSGYCLPIDASGGVPAFPAQQNRVAFAATLVGRTDRPLGAVSGVRPGSEPTVTATSTTWTVTPFVAAVDPGTALNVGPFLVAFDTNQTGAINAADANNTRIDRLDVQVPDDPAGAYGTSPKIVYTAGVASPTPAVPAAPVRSFPLAQITVPKSSAGNPSVSVASMTRSVASGGVLPCASTATYPAHPYKGQLIYDQALDAVKRWNGTAWIEGGMSDTGWITDTGGDSVLSGTGYAAGGAQIVQYWVRKVGPIVQLYVSYTMAAVTVGTTGDLPNVQILTMEDSRFIPTVKQGLGSGDQGRTASHSIDSTGAIKLCSVAGSANIAQGDAFSVSDTYFVG